MNTFYFRISLLLLMATLAATIFGCSDGRPRRYQVKGIVQVDGNPLVGNSECVLRFFPDDGSRPSTGKIGSDGSFTLSTYEKDDGCPKGNYTVVIIATETGAGKMTYLVPPRYGEKNKTDLKTEISGSVDSLILNVEWTDKDKAFKRPVNLGDMGV